MLTSLLPRGCQARVDQQGGTRRHTEANLATTLEGLVSE